MTRNKIGRALYLLCTAAALLLLVLMAAAILRGGYGSLYDSTFYLTFAAIAWLIGLAFHKVLVSD